MKDLNIRWKFISSSYGIMIVTVMIICAVLSYSLHGNIEQEVTEFRNLEVQKTKVNLKNNVDIVYSLLDEAKTKIDSGQMSLAEAQKSVILKIKEIRYDAGVGYFWINDTGEPFPKMIMHPTLPELDGKFLDAPKFNCALGQKKNLFQAMVETCRKKGDGFVDYLWQKPTDKGLTIEQPKLSYVRLYEPFGWIIGTGKYIDDIDTAVEKKKKNTKALINNLYFEIFGISIAVLLLAFIPLVIFSKSIVKPILDCITFAKEVENGNLANVVVLKRKDETGRLVNALNSMVNTMRKILSDVYQHTALVALASNNLASTSEKMTVTARQSSERAGSVADAAKQASTNISSVSNSILLMSDRANNIASNISETSDNINTIASSVEEMSNSFKEVAAHCNKAQVTAEKNLKTSDLASTQINELHEAATNIGSVVSLIDEITEQTKLLALNATIEAARAGESGRGFAVVAGEVKELANQTAQATETIADRIRDMQIKTENMVKMIQEGSVNNQELNDINTSIASTVEEQSMTAVEIARAIADTAQSASRVSVQVKEVTSTIQNEISNNIQGAAKKVADVSSSIMEVTQGVQKNSGAAAGNIYFANELSRVAAELRESFGSFNLGFRKFDIGMIKAAHLAWRLHLDAMLHQGASLSVDDIPDHTQCDFGKWLATEEALELKPLDAYPEMIRLHEKIHTLATRIAEYYHQGRQEKATALMEEFKETSEKLFTSLDSLYTS